MKHTHSRSGRTKLALLLATMALPLAGAAGAHAQRADAGQTGTLGPNLVVNGGFERGIDPGRFFVFPTGDTSSLLQGWTMLSAGLDKFHPAVVYVGSYLPCEEGKRCLALANGGENPANIGGVKQTLATTAGQKYQLSFYQSADIFDTEPRTLKVTVAGQSQSYNYMPLPGEWQNPQKMRWIQRTITFTATAATTTLEFDSVLASPGGKGSLLDNVQVRAILPPAGAPTPGIGKPPITTTVQLTLASVAAGGTQTVQGTARANGAVALIIDYPDGSQLETSAKTGVDGKYTFTWTVPSTVHGAVHVLADGAGSISQATFAVK